MAKIGVMDSGSGGLSVLRELLRILPEEEYIYFSDNAHCPYGEKSQGFILGRCRSIVEDFLAQGAQAVVIACNTATAAAIATLREEYPHIPFVGMEPAIKPAILDTRCGTIGVLATESTLHSAKYLDTRERYAQGIKVVEHVGEGFVELVETLDLDSAHTREVVERSLRPLLERGADTIVLGCTHYPFLRKVIERVAGPGVQVIDPAPAVARHLAEVMKQEGLLDHEYADVPAAAEPLTEGQTAAGQAAGEPEAAHPAAEIELIASGPEFPARRLLDTIISGHAGRQTATKS